MSTSPAPRIERIELSRLPNGGVSARLGGAVLSVHSDSADAAEAEALRRAYRMLADRAVPPDTVQVVRTWATLASAPRPFDIAPEELNPTAANVRKRRRG